MPTGLDAIPELKPYSTTYSVVKTSKIERKKGQQQRPSSGNKDENKKRSEPINQNGNFITNKKIDTKGVFWVKLTWQN